MIKRVLASIGVIVTASVAYVMLQPEVIKVVDDGVVIEHETRADSVLEVLEELNITLDETDYVTPALSGDVP
ncbi:MAG: ubiquitin-like domain-containing protein, partial [Exiguobacterium marinum]